MPGPQLAALARGARGAVPKAAARAALVLVLPAWDRDGRAATIRVRTLDPPGPVLTLPGDAGRLYGADARPIALRGADRRGVPAPAPAMVRAVREAMRAGTLKALRYRPGPARSLARPGALSALAGPGAARNRQHPERWGRRWWGHRSCGWPARPPAAFTHGPTNRAGRLRFCPAVPWSVWSHTYPPGPRTGFDDPTAGYALRLLLDSIFGGRNFRREIVWQLKGAAGFKALAANWIRGHDTILFYRRGPRATFNKLYLPYDAAQLKRFSKTDSDGRKYKPITRTRRIYLDEAKGVPATSVWGDIASFQTVVNAPERLGYPTQKPRALLERIIKASSNEGDLVLDPFCGCGTAVDAAHRLGRRWAGVDISSFAIDLIRKRRMADHDIAVKGIPYDLQSARKLARDQPFNFESWAVTRLPGFAPNTREVGDGGADGRATLAVKPADFDSRLALAQVKGGKFGLSQLRDFMRVQDRDKAAVGVYVTLDSVTSRTARTEAAGARTVTVGAEQYRRCQLWSIAEHFDDRRPHLPTMTDPYNGKPLIQGEMFA